MLGQFLASFEAVVRLGAFMVIILKRDVEVQLRGTKNQARRGWRSPARIGGDYRIESRLGVGTTVRITIPMQCLVPARNGDLNETSV